MSSDRRPNPSTSAARPSQPPTGQAERAAANAATSGWSDQRVESLIGILLRAGVLLSAAVIVFGGIFYLIRHGSDIADYHSFRGELSPLRTLPGIFHNTRLLSGRAIIQFGLLLLIATPVARVLFSAIVFALQRDYLYTFFTLAVLAILAYSLFGPSLF
jgi:uncharacterized membrane protein